MIYGYSKKRINFWAKACFAALGALLCAAGLSAGGAWARPTETENDAASCLRSMRMGPAIRFFTPSRAPQATARSHGRSFGP